jgi:hypothetical protein
MSQVASLRCRKETILYLCLLAALWGCKKNNPSADAKEALRVPVKPSGQKLEKKYSILGKTNYEVTLREFSGLEKLPLPYRTFLQIRVYPKDEIEFRDLKSRLGATASLRYISNRTYELQDFMPPLVSATLNHQFLTRKLRWQDLKTNEKCSALLASNCWGTAFEYVRNDPISARVFFTSKFNFTKFLESQEQLHGEFQEQNTWSELKNKFLPSKIRPFSERPVTLTLVFRRTFSSQFAWEQADLRHVAVELDNDLYFEKTGLEDSFVYRFLDQRTMEEMYPDSGFLKRKLQLPMGSFKTPESYFERDLRSVNSIAEQCGWSVHASAPLAYEFEKETGIARLEGFEASKKGVPSGAYTKEYYLPKLSDAQNPSP